MEWSEPQVMRLACSSYLLGSLETIHKPNIIQPHIVWDVRCILVYYLKKQLQLCAIVHMVGWSACSYEMREFKIYMIVFSLSLSSSLYVVGFCFQYDR